VARADLLDGGRVVGHASGVRTESLHEPSIERKPLPPGLLPHVQTLWQLPAPQ